MPSDRPQFISKESFELLYKKIREFIDESGVIITEFAFKFPYYDTPGVPIEVKVHVEMMN